MICVVDANQISSLFTVCAINALNSSEFSDYLYEMIRAEAFSIRSCYYDSAEISIQKILF